jgi:23S rRNA pseudouridine2605 synthase
MPRRNESGPGRKGSARSGGGKSFSGRARSSGKPFKRSDKDDSKNSSGGKSFSSKRYSSSGSGGRPEHATGKRKSAGRSFKRSAGEAESTSGRTFSKKSRFAKPPDKSFRETGSGSSDRRGVDKKPFSRDVNAPKPRRGASDKPFKKSSDTSGFSPKGFGNKRRFSEESEDRPKGRSDSFGKPFKKSYRAKPDSESEKTTGKTSSEIRPRRRRVREDASTSPKSDKIRLNKFIANSGISSRREADELITLGLISVNGKIVSELGYKVNPGDEVRYENKVLRAEKPVYILMNKPKGFLTTTDDPQERKTVMHIIGSAVKERIYPVGRLDRNTTGLLLLTNDGDLADKLMHPSFNVKKIYKVELDHPLTKADFQAILDGVRLEEGRALVDDLAIVSDDGRTIGIELHIGWNRVVRRIFESLGYEVIKLDRSVYAGLDKKELSRGQWRFLTKEEIIHLKHFN